MLMKDIEVGAEYLASTYQSIDGVEMFTIFGREDSKDPWSNEWAREWRGVLEAADKNGQRVLVVEKGVTLSSYQRPGLRVRHLDKQTGEPLPDCKDPSLPRESEKRAVQIVMPWDRFTAIYLDVLTAYEEAEADRREQQEKAKQERQERAAQRWVETEFGRARSSLEEMRAIGWTNVVGTDENIRKLVEYRFPNGNPYQNGEREER